MDNHYHLLIETSMPTLSKGIKYLNGTYTQFFNRSRKRVGHVFQGRFKGILVEKDSYLLELSRYIVLNPVRFGMVRSARDWRWSSYRGTLGLSHAHSCLTTDWVLSGFAKQRRRAQQKYQEFVKQGRHQTSVWSNFKNQIYLGTDEFVEAMQKKIDPEQSLLDIPKAQKQAPMKPLDYYQNKYPHRNEAMASAYLSGHYTLQAVGAKFNVSYGTVSRAVKVFECEM